MLKEIKYSLTIKAVNIFKALKHTVGLNNNNSKYLLSACCSEYLTNSFNSYHSPMRIGVVIMLVLQIGNSEAQKC